VPITQVMTKMMRTSSQKHHSPRLPLPTLWRAPANHRSLVWSLIRKNSQQSDSRELYPSRDKIKQHRRAAVFQDFRDVKPLSEDLEGASKRASSLFGFLPSHQHLQIFDLRSARSSFSGNAEGQREMKMENQTARESEVVCTASSPKKSASD
jgi:hypothetical protein